MKGYIAIGSKHLILVENPVLNRKTSRDELILISMSKGSAKAICLMSFIRKALESLLLSETYC